MQLCITLMMIIETTFDNTFYINNITQYLFKKSFLFNHLINI